MDCIAHGVAKSWARLSDFHFHFSADTSVKMLAIFHTDLFEVLGFSPLPRDMRTVRAHPAGLRQLGVRPCLSYAKALSLDAHGEPGLHVPSTSRMSASSV